ncbi:MAG: hypothetical protein AB1758_10945, partial [Candidatus Eremiobacterota bacterium]
MPLWSRIVLSLGILALIGGGAILFSPDLRMQVMGARLTHRVQAGDEGDVSFTATLTRGRELLGSGEAAAEPSLQEHIQLNFTLHEKVQSAGREEALEYSMRSMRSEQLNAEAKRILSHERFLLRVAQAGGLVDLSRPADASRDVLGDSALSQLFLGIWLPLSPSWVRPGKSQWSAAVNLDSEPLAGEKVRLQHRLDIRFSSIEERAGKRLALLDYAGTIAPTGEGVTGQGRILGKSLVDLETGTALVGSMLLEQDVRLEDPELGVTYRFYEHQDVKFWRPA